MLLNLFFDHMNAQLEIFLIGAFIFAIYWFVLRKHNSLGLRLLVLCVLLFAGCCVWIYKDEVRLENTLVHGEEHIASVIAKAKTGNNDNEVTVSFTAKDGSAINTKTSMYVSAEEWEKFETGKPLSVIYVAGSNETYVQQSVLRFRGDKIYLYFFAGFWLLLGGGLYAWLYKIKVGVDENTGAEWLIRPDGSVFFDERKSKASQVMKRVNILSKLTQSLAR